MTDNPFPSNLDLSGQWRHDPERFVVQMSPDAVACLLDWPANQPTQLVLTAPICTTLATAFLGWGVLSLDCAARRRRRSSSSSSSSSSQTTHIGPPFQRNTQATRPHPRSKQAKNAGSKKTPARSFWRAVDPIWAFLSRHPQSCLYGRVSCLFVRAANRLSIIHLTSHGKGMTMIFRFAKVAVQSLPPSEPSWHLYCAVKVLGPSIKPLTT